MEHKPTEIEQWLMQLGQPSADRDYQPGHERILGILTTSYRPALRIRVAGTNGKGSTSFMLATALETAGYRVGLYTSPHILHFNERIRINRQAVSDQTIYDALSTIMPKALQVDASYFEVATAAALHIFAAQQVDVEILEAGVGARLDATTAVPADMAVLTPIALDHQHWLGESLADIAQEKVHVFDGCRWGVSAPQEASVQAICTQHYPTLAWAKPYDITPSLWGAHQQRNAALAWQAMNILRDEELVNLSPAQIQHAIVTTHIPGRMQHIICHDHEIYVDAAHNTHAVDALMESFQQQGIHFDAIIVQTREDRSLDNTLTQLATFTHHLYSGHADLAQHETSVCQTLQHAMYAHPKGTILVLGSFVTIAAVMRYVDKNMRL